MIVLFKEGQTPQELKNEVTQRQALKESLTGKTQIFLENLAAQLKNKMTVEEKYTQLSDIARDFGFSGAKNMFSGFRSPETESRLNRYFVYQASQTVGIEDALDRFRSLPFVESAQPNDIWTTAYPSPSDPYFGNQWPLVKLQATTAWDKTRGSNTLTIAIVDSGMDTTHPDFAGRSIVSGYDFTTCNLFDTDGNCLSPKSRDANPMDNFGHGTMVTGIAAAATNNGLGIAGLDWYAKIMPLKALVETGGYASDIVDAIVYAVDHGAKVINLSLGAPVACTSAEQEAINYAYSRGVVVVAAAGNENANAANTTPAGCQHVVTVAATDQYDARAPYSNYGAVVDVAAPGGN